MSLEDRLTIETPEGVSIDVTLAGLGSRMGAAIIDLLIQIVALLALSIALALGGATLSPDLGVFVMGVGTLVIAAVVLGYYLVFESLNGGRTPGKAAFGIRVATVDGRPVSFGSVAIRTLFRVVDFLPAVYAIGAIVVMVSARNQRLGDLVAGTVVVRDRLPAPALPAEMGGRALGWDVAAITEAEMALLRRFASRRTDLTAEARTHLASETARRLRPKVSGGQGLDDEAFLLQLIVEKQAR
jgi:uncharacterized RDD family membrane protein YckC